MNKNIERTTNNTITCTTNTMMKNAFRIIAIILMLSAALMSFMGNDSFAASTRPGKVKGLKTPLKDQGCNELHYMSDLNIPNAIPYSYEREAFLKWKKVKGADGYKIFLSTKGPKKGFKPKKTTKDTQCTIYYNGIKKYKVWVKVKAYKKVNGKTVFGKASKVKKIVILSTPILKSVKVDKDYTKLTIKWNSVYAAKYYKVIAYIHDGEKEIEKCIGKTKNTRLDYTPEKDDILITIGVKAVRGNRKTPLSNTECFSWDKALYEWEHSEEGKNF